MEKKAPQIKPHLFGKYCLLERVSVGGMAEVFRAKPFDVPDFRGYLALKRILPHLAEDDEFIDMFIDEAKLTVNLTHPNVIRTYELGKFHNSYYILMEYISGRDLLGIQKRMRRTKQIMDIHACIYIAHEVARGLHYAHQAQSVDGQTLNLIHRDISPQNILLSYQGAVKVIDFGIAKAVVQSTKTQVGVLKGKMGYMSPEQVLGNTFDSRSDLFALGTVLWEMLTNRRLFSGPNEFETMKMVQNPQVAPPSSVNPKIPPALDAIIARALNADPDRRFQTGEEFAAALSPFLRPESPQMFAAWFQSIFEDELVREREKHQEFLTIRTPEDVQERLQEAYVGKQAGDENIWDADILQEEEKSLKEFADEHTIIQAGGFDLDLVELDTNELEILEIEDLEDLGLIEEIDEHDVHNIIAEPSQNRTAFKRENTAKQHLTKENRVPVLAMIGAIAALVVIGLGAFIYSQIGEDLTLTITSTPQGSEIIVDGTSIGRTPLKIPNITEGAHLIEAKKKGFINFSETYESSEANQKLAIELKRAETRGFVTIVAKDLPEDAIFFVNGAETDFPKSGKAFSLPKGRHLFEIFSKKFKPFSEIVQLDEKKDIVISLESKKIPLSIKAPDSAEVSVGDLFLTAPFDVELAPNKIHHISISEQKFETHLGFLELVKGEIDYEKSPKLKAADYGWIMISVNEPHWQVEIDGLATGLTTPFAIQDRIPLRAGSHSISLRRGEMSYGFKVDIQAGETSSVRKKVKFSWQR